MPDLVPPLLQSQMPLAAALGACCHTTPARKALGLLQAAGECCAQGGFSYSFRSSVRLSLFKHGLFYINHIHVNHVHINRVRRRSR